MNLLRSPRGWGLLVFALLVMTGCVLAGLWQLDRYQERGARNDAVRTALAADPVSFESLVPDGLELSQIDSAIEWRTVLVNGRFDADSQLLLRLRPVEGSAGLHALAVLELDDGRAVLVDRGFLPTSSRSTDALDVPSPPTGAVELSGRVRLSEDAGGSGLDSDSQPPSIRFVDLADLQDRTSADLAPVWMERIDQTPAEDDALMPIPEPKLSAGPSLIYTVQWFLFGAIAIVGFVILARRDTGTDAENEHTPAEDSSSSPGDTSESSAQAPR